MTDKEIKQKHFKVFFFLIFIYKNKISFIFAKFRMGRGYFILKRENAAGKPMYRKVTIGNDTQG